MLAGLFNRWVNDEWGTIRSELARKPLSGVTEPTETSHTLGIQIAMKSRIRGCQLLVAFAICVTACTCQGQTDKPWKLPDDLRPQLNARLLAFTEAQANGEWNVVEELLGKYRRGGNYLSYTPSHRACLLDEMRQFPMTDFHYQVQDRFFSDEILTTPPERRWWTLVGDATFRQNGKELKKQIYLVAYRDSGNWYFTPPAIDNATAASHFTPEELATDLRDKIELRVAPGSPLQFSELHAFTDKNDVRNRKVQFRLRNVTAKRVTRYSYRVSDSNNDGSTTFGTGNQKDWIDPWSESHEFNEEAGTGYYWCEGGKEIRTIIEILDVGFEDGSEWTLPKSAGADDATSARAACRSSHRVLGNNSGFGRFPASGKGK